MDIAQINNGSPVGRVKDWYDVKNLNNGSVQSINIKNCELKPLNDPECVLFSSSDVVNMDAENAKFEELKKWKANDVYTEVLFKDQDFTRDYF